MTFARRRHGAALLTGAVVAARARGEGVEFCLLLGRELGADLGAEAFAESLGLGAGGGVLLGAFGSEGFQRVALFLGEGLELGFLGVGEVERTGEVAQVLAAGAVAVRAASFAGRLVVGRRRRWRRVGFVGCTERGDGGAQRDGEGREEEFGWVVHSRISQITRLVTWRRGAGYPARFFLPVGVAEGAMCGAWHA